MGRAYQLLTFITASAMLLVGGVQFLWERLTGPAASLVAGMLLIVLYLTFKAIAHCLRAIAPRESVGIAPNLVEDGRRVLGGRRQADRVALELLDIVARAHPINDRVRAVSVEHGELAVRTIGTYAFMVVVTLATIVIGGFHSATADSVPASAGRDDSGERRGAVVSTATGMAEALEAPPGRLVRPASDVGTEEALRNKSVHQSLAPESQSSLHVPNACHSM